MKEDGVLNLKIVDLFGKEIKTLKLENKESVKTQTFNSGLSMVSIGDLAKVDGSSLTIDLSSVSDKLQMNNYDLEFSFSNGIKAFSSFGIRRKISNDVRITLGQQKNWDVEHEWIESEGFPKQLPVRKTESFPILDITILTYFEGDGDRLKPIESVCVIL